MPPSIESNPFERPSFERMRGDFEWSKEPLPQLREATPDQIRKTREHNTLSKRLYESHCQIEDALRGDFEKCFDAHRDTIWRTGDVTLLGWETALTLTLSQGERGRKPLIEKRTKDPDAPGEKEKLTTYAELSNLAYVDFVTIQDPADPLKTTEQVSRVQLDPLAFPHFKMIAEGGIPAKPTEDERIILSYMDEHQDDPARWILRARNDREIAPDIADLLRLAAGPRKNPEKLQYASLEETLQSTMIDANPSLPRTSGVPDIESVTGANDRIVDAMEHLRTIKEKQASKTLDVIKGKGFEIVDYFPSKASKDSTSSGFGAICLKDQVGNIHFAIRWTELTDWGDIIADARLVMKHVPENQTNDMIAFFERNLKNIPPNQKIRIAGHSLGGALTQIASVMYRERIYESYTFNSPGAKKFTINAEDKSGVIRQKFEKFRDFEYTGGEESVESRITNVRWIKGISLIANLGEDIGEYEITLKELDSHSITRVIEYINALKEGSPELVKRYIGNKKEKENRSKESIKR